MDVGGVIVALVLVGFVAIVVAGIRISRRGSVYYTESSGWVGKRGNYRGGGGGGDGGGGGC